MCTTHVGWVRFGWLGLLAVIACATPRPVLDLRTAGERSKYVRTGRYDEAVQLCHDFARMYAEARCAEFGRTVEDRPLVALRIARQPGLPVVLIQAGIHAGEIEGKDAGFAFLRDVLAGTAVPGVLDTVSFVFVPVINPDGHERMTPNNRPNQRGPVEMGTRSTAARLNLNRDFMKVDAPETRALIGLVRVLDPVLFIDLHTTDGAQFEHDISVSLVPLAPTAGGLEGAGAAIAHATQQRLTALGHLPLDFYPSFRDDELPTTGFAKSEGSPRFGQFYLGVRDRLAALVETHSWRTYKERAISTYHALQALAELAQRDAATWRQQERAASAASAALAGTDVVVTWKVSDRSHPIEFRGYAYEVRTSELTGAPWIVYDERTPQVWTVPMFDELVPDITIAAPRAGYVVDGGYAPAVIAALDTHGITYQRIAGQPALPVEVFRALTIQFAQGEGRNRATVTGTWTPETRTLDRGALFIPMNQPLGRLALHLMEPRLADSFTAWGFFNTAFESKEYIEAYVIEVEARAMLAKDPTLRAQFDAAVAAEPELAKSAEWRRTWFYRRHPSWDERRDLVPVYRVSTAP